MVPTAGRRRALSGTRGSVEGRNGGEGGKQQRHSGRALGGSALLRLVLGLRLLILQTFPHGGVLLLSSLQLLFSLCDLLLELFDALLCFLVFLLLLGGGLLDLCHGLVVRGSGRLRIPFRDGLLQLLAGFFQLLHALFQVRGLFLDLILRVRNRTRLASELLQIIFGLFSI